MNAVRSPAVAGTFYTADPAELARSIDTMLAAVDASGPVPKAVIAPHAGHIFSGPIAASVYARIRKARRDISRVVLLGPSHRVGFRGIAATSSTIYRTPLGDIPVDTDAIRAATGLPGTGILDEAHTEEHSLEVHLPFLQRVLDKFSLVPLVVGDADKQDVARVLETLWGGTETLIVVSSDLSHYHSYGEARRIDAGTSAKILAMDSNLLGEEACGCRPINGLMHLAKQRGLSVEQVDVRNSGDTAGTHDRVVGYGAYVLTERKRLPLSSRQQLLQVAREAVLRPLISSEKYHIDLNHFTPVLREHGASFVTLNTEGRLRGCIGSLIAHRALVVDVAHNAQAAAFNDPRFKSLSLEEYASIDVHVSILGEPEPVHVQSREGLIEILRPGVDGLIIEESGRRATYLPSVWAQLPDAEDFVGELRRKAGLARDGWSSDTKVFRYTTEEFS